MLKSDLHIHSRHSSDGEYDIQFITEKCIENGLDVFSITDHNSVKGAIEAKRIVNNYNIDFITGIEIDCRHKDTDLHLLGYGINTGSVDFENLEKDVFRKTMDSFDQMIVNLEHLGIYADRNNILHKANGGLPTGELIAEVLLADKNFDDEPLLQPYRPAGKRGDMPYLNFYLDFFAQGKPAYVKIEYLRYTEAVELIRANNGTPVVAHPGLNFKGRETTAEELLGLGAEGLEVFNNYHNPEQTAYFAGLATKTRKVMTCGSDFHGKTKPTINIGSYGRNNQFDEYIDKSLKKLQAARM